MAKEKKQKEEDDKKIELKWVHYLYEFFIVVLGISVPFLLSKCNENSVLRKTELIYLENIKQDLVQDSMALYGNQLFNQRLIDNSHLMSQIIITQDHLLADSLAKKALLLTEFSDFHKGSSVYETLSKSGELDVLTNIELVTSLGRLDELYTYINRLEDNNNQIIFSVFPELSKNIQLKPLKAKNIEALYQHEFHNMVLVFGDIYVEKDSLYGEALQHIGSLINFLDDEVSK